MDSNKRCLKRLLEIKLQDRIKIKKWQMEQEQLISTLKQNREDGGTLATCQYYTTKTSRKMNEMDPTQGKKGIPDGMWRRNIKIEMKST